MYCRCVRGDRESGQTACTIPAAFTRLVDYREISRTLCCYKPYLGHTGVLSLILS